MLGKGATPERNRESDRGCCHHYSGAKEIPTRQFNTALSGRKPHGKIRLPSWPLFRHSQEYPSVSQKKSIILAVSQNGITLHCSDNVNAVLGPWVPSHRLGDPLHKRAAYRKQRSQKIPPALCRYSVCPLAFASCFQGRKRRRCHSRRSSGGGWWQRQVQAERWNQCLSALRSRENPAHWPLQNNAI